MTIVLELDLSYAMFFSSVFYECPDSIIRGCFNQVTVPDQVCCGIYLVSYKEEMRNFMIN